MVFNGPWQNLVWSLFSVEFILIHILHGEGQVRSHKFAMGGVCLGVWGQTPSHWKHGGLGAEPPTLKNFAFFCKNNLIIGLF